jgi:SAM-dependent methyltransferase
MSLFAMDRNTKKRLDLFLRIIGHHAAKCLGVSVGELADHAIAIMSQDQMSDLEILHMLVSLFSSTTDNPCKTRARSKLAKMKKELKIIGESHPKMYLDIGCGSGEITEAVANKLGIAKAYACDVMNITPGPTIHFSQCSEDCLLYKSNQFDLITMFMSAHHFTNVHALFREARRVARRGAFLLMREHGVADTCYYDIIHALYSCTNIHSNRATTGSTPEKFLQKYTRPEKYAHYNTMHGWINIATRHGFFLVVQPHVDKQDLLFDSVNMLFQLNKKKRQ